MSVDRAMLEPSPIERIAELLQARGVAIADVPFAVKMLLLGFHLGRDTPPWTPAGIERPIDMFFPLPGPTIEEAVRSRSQRGGAKAST